jgi:enterochelin esterase-like enzyme
VLYFLHGFGDDESAWNKVGKVSAIMDNLIALQACEEMIVVMPNGHPVPIPEEVEFDEYAPKNLSLMERDLLEDLRPYIAHHFQVSTSHQHQAIAGLSMDGGQATCHNKSVKKKLKSLLSVRRQQNSFVTNPFSANSSHFY